MSQSSERLDSTRISRERPSTPRRYLRRAASLDERQIELPQEASHRGLACWGLCAATLVPYPSGGASADYVSKPVPQPSELPHAEPCGVISPGAHASDGGYDRWRRLGKISRVTGGVSGEQPRLYEFDIEAVLRTN